MVGPMAYTHLSLGNNSFMNSEAAGPELEQPEVVAHYNIRKSCYQPPSFRSKTLLLFRIVVDSADPVSA